MRIQAEDVTHVYMANTPFERKALHQLNTTIEKGHFTSVIGHTGSGKSTLIQHLNGLLMPSSGLLRIGSWTITPRTKQKELFELRRRTGMVFQFPEHQLFHETVLEDAAYGPENYGCSKAEAREKAAHWLDVTGVSSSLFNRSPFDLSGGQMRRVAIAGVLALEPDLLILDEPAAGLDPAGHEAMMQLFTDWFREKKERTVILVTHQMEDAARLSDRILVMAEGTVSMEGTPAEIFSSAGELEAMGLSVPESVKLLTLLREKSGEAVDTTPFTLEDTVKELRRFVQNRKDVTDHV